MAKFTKSELKNLKKLSDSIKAKDRLGEGKCAPTGLRFADQAETLKGYEEIAKTDSQTRNMLIAQKKSLREQIANELKQVQEFDKYWSEHRKEIIAECDKAAKILDSMKNVAVVKRR